MARALSSTTWRRRLAKLAECLPRHRLHPAVVAAADRLRTRGPWAVALSGGADSVALLLLLRAHWPQRSLIALHFNHRLRGRSAEADERFCHDLCGVLGIRFRSGRRRKNQSLVSEAAAREARMDFLQRAMRQVKSKALWLGHQRDDVAESMLMRLARGSGTAGLAAPRPVQRFPDDRFHLRPLLDLRRDEIEGCLRQCGIRWRTDASNATPDFLRNRIRHQVIPAWCRAVSDRDALAGAALARERLQEDDEALEAWLDRLDPVNSRGELDLEQLEGLPRAIWRRALHRWLQRIPRGPALSRQGFDRLLAGIEAGQPFRFSLGASGFAVVRKRCLRTEPL